MGAIDIAAVENRRELKQFVELPYRLYRDNPHWVPPLRIAVRELLDRHKHPFYRENEAEFFTAYRDGQAVGRIAAILDKVHNRFHGEQAGFFGFFECVDDQAVADALLASARAWLRARGAQVVRGPVNPSTNYECGLLIEGFDSSPTVMMPFNPPYYAFLMERAGLRKAKDLYAYYVRVDALDNRKIERIAKGIAGLNGMQVRPINLKDFDADVERTWQVYNSAWSRNWGFVPLSREEFVAMAKEMKQILKPDLVLIGEIGDRTVGFALALPDANQALKPAGGRLFPTGLLKILYHQRKINTVRVLTFGVVEEFRASGVGAALYAELIRNGRKLGFEHCEMSWILEDNVLMNRSLERMGAARYKTYRIYEWN